jgi:hypothetical protein
MTLTGDFRALNPRRLGDVLTAELDGARNGRPELR